VLTVRACSARTFPEETCLTSDRLQLGDGRRHSILRTAKAALAWVRTAIAVTVLTALYFLVFTPAAIIARMQGADPLRLKRAPGGSSYWIERTGNNEAFFFHLFGARLPPSWNGGTASGKWTLRAPALIGLLLLLDLLGSASVRQIRVVRGTQQTIAAEMSQEPYRDTDWGRAYWTEIGRYQEKWQPYVMYRLGEMQGQYINVTQGVRRTYAPRTSAATHPNLVFLFGGSAAWGHGVRDYGTLPSWLARVSEEHDELLDVRNYAESGWVNWQGIVYLLQKLADGQRPKIVIFYSGVNEFLSARQWPYVRRPLWNAQFYPAAMRDWMLQKDRPLLRVWDYYRNTSLILSALLPHELEYPAVQSPIREEVIRVVANDYAADKAVVEALGRQYGFSTLFVWQLTVASKKTLSAQERRYAGWLPRSPENTPALSWWSMPEDFREDYSRIGTKVISEAEAVDLSPAFDSMVSTAFIDWMHPTEAGNEAIARLLYDRLASKLHQMPNPPTS
jgi:hypothetical protein